MKSFPLLFFILIFTSCQGKNSPKSDQSKVAIALGDTVPKLSNSILIVFQASNGDYWFGSDTNGVFWFDGHTIINYTEKDGLSSNRIRGIQEDKQGNIYFSTLNGISKFNGHTFTTLSAIKSDSQADNWKLQPNDLWFCMPGNNGENGPYRYDGKNLYQLEFPKHYLADEYFKNSPNLPWSPYEVYYIHKDKIGTMWFGTSNFGICRYDGKTWSWLFEDHLTNVPNGGSFGIRSILEDSKGKFWFCNTRNRYRISSEIIHENGKSLIKYEKETGIERIKTAEGLDYVYFLSIIEDKQGDLWMATYKEGVWRYNGKEVKHYAVKDGIKDVTLYTVYQDNRGGIWLGTHQNGAYQYNGKAFEKFRPVLK